MFDAEDVERQRFGAGRDDTIFGDDAVLLTAADELAGEQQERPLAAIDQDELVDGRAAGVIWVEGVVGGRVCEPGQRRLAR